MEPEPRRPEPRTPGDGSDIGDRSRGTRSDGTRMSSARTRDVGSRASDEPVRKLTDLSRPLKWEDRSDPELVVEPVIHRE